MIKEDGVMKGVLQEDEMYIPMLILCSISKFISKKVQFQDDDTVKGIISLAFCKGSNENPINI